MADARARFLITADDRASKKLRGVKQEIDGIGKSLTRISRISLGGALSVGGLTALAQRSIQTADALGKTADRLGLTVEAFQEYQFAAEQAGINSRTFETAIQRLGRRFAEADKGIGEAKGAFEELGISTRDAEGNLKTIDDLLPELADAFGQVNTQLDRNRLAFKLFDTEGVAFVNLLREGSQGLEQLREQARQSGIVIREDLVRGAEQANDKLNLLSRIVSTQVTQAVLEATPAVLALTEAFTSLSVEALKAFNATGQGLGILAGQLVEGQRTINAYRDEQLQTLDAEIERLEKEQRAFQAGLTRDPGFDLDEQIRKLKNKRDAIKANNDEELRTARLQREINDLIFQSQNVPRVQAPALGGEGIQRDAGAADRAASSVRRETEAQKELVIAVGETREQKERLLLLEDTIARVDPVAPLLKQLDALEELKRAYPQYADIVVERQFQIQDEIDQVNAGLEEQVAVIEEVGNQWQGFGDIAASALEDAIIEGKSFSDVIKGLEKDIIRLVTRNLITKPLSDALSSFLSPSGGGGDFFSSIFAGARASGGPVLRDQAYLVGERGPELFMPQTSGQILSNADTRQAMARTVTVNVYGAKDPDEFRRSMPQVQRAARRAILSAS